MSTKFLDHIRHVEDHRIVGMTTYPLDEILFTVLVGLLCGMDDFDEITLFGVENLSWLQRFLPFENGIASAHTLRRALRALDPKALQTAFAAWVASMRSHISGVVAIDGKTLRGSKQDRKGTGALYIVSAYAHEAGLVLAAVATDEKSNEITAIPELLNMLNLASSVVTIDAMGTQKAIAAKERGASRICLGAAWREVKNNRDFETVLRQVRSIAALGIEVCCTLGMLNHKAADDLKKAGLTAYNHNLDSSEQFYGEIVHTRTYQDRLNTIVLAKSAGLSICSGGIIGMGESIEDRANLLLRLQSIRPESVPINALVPVSGTPLGQRQRIDSFAIVQMIAAARVVLPHAMIRISAGRDILSDADHALCFLAGANSIFYDDQLLTAPNPSCDRDDALLAKLGLHRSRNLALRS